MLYVGSFKLDGTSVSNSARFSVFRKGNVLAIEFLNNIVLPFVVIEVDNRCILCVGPYEVLNVRMDAVLSVRMRGGMTATDVDFELSDGRGIVSNINVTFSGDVMLTPYPEKHILAKEFESWILKCGVVRPEGCSQWVGQFAGTPGHSFDISPEWFIIGFPNGFRFPMQRHATGVKIVESVMQFPLGGPSGFFLRTKFCDIDKVHFTISFVAGGGLVTAEDIVYTKDYAEFSGNRVKTVDLTKQLFMSVGAKYVFSG